MSKRDAEIVNDYKHVFASMFSTPHLRELPGMWYYFEKEGERSFVSIVDGDVLDGLPQDTGFGYMTEVLGYTATPLLIYKVDADKLR